MFFRRRHADGAPEPRRAPTGRAFGLRASSGGSGARRPLQSQRTVSARPIAADRRSGDGQRLPVDGGDKRLLLDGETLRDRPWLVCRIGMSDRRPDFGTIPDLKQAWDAFRLAVRSRKRRDADDALTVFRVTAFTSPGLIRVDVEGLAREGEELMKSSFPA